MTAIIRTITIDCADAEAVGRFWEVLLGWRLELESDGSQYSRGESLLANPAGGPNLLFQRVPKPDGTGWVVMADPEGNEFCVVRSDAERNLGSQRS
jgi:catechol 2,3-dioxygenase-like lactoylglutathione lyase family enzyme